MAITETFLRQFRVAASKAVQDLDELNRIFEGLHSGVIIRNTDNTFSIRLTPEQTDELKTRVLTVGNELKQIGDRAITAATT